MASVQDELRKTTQRHRENLMGCFVVVVVLFAIGVFECLLSF